MPDAMPQPHGQLPLVLRWLEQDRAAARARWFDLLRIPSVSAQPAHAADCAAAAGLLRTQLTELGFDAAVYPTPGHPVVVAHHPGPGTDRAGGPRVLIYGHYDVQPAEPFELWTSPPFEPTVADGPNGPKVVARGAVDDKGQVSLWMEALRAWHAVAGAPPVPVTVLIEGEEEVGSPNLDAFLEAHADALRADVGLICDTGMWDKDTPAITTRLRGLCYVEVVVRAAERDLHSGIFGGSAANANNLLTRILGDLHDETGRIQVPGFYDGVGDPSPSLSAAWQALGFDEAAFLGGVGLSHPVGERGRPALERLWARPTADVNGIWGGYAGPGSKTVIPAEAGAKVSFRLVPGQDPHRIAAAFEAFVRARLPPDAQASFTLFGAAPAAEVPESGAYVRAAQGALQEEWDRPAALIGSGGSIPVVESMRRLLGIDTLLIGFGLDGDQVHSPNEKFDLRCFEKGARSIARVLGALAAER